MNFFFGYKHPESHGNKGKPEHCQPRNNINRLKHLHGNIPGYDLKQDYEKCALRQKSC